MTRNLKQLKGKVLVKIEEGRNRTFREISLTKNGIGSLVKARPLRKEVPVHVVSQRAKDRAGQFIKDLSSLTNLAGAPAF